MQMLLGYFLFTVLLRTGATFKCMSCRKQGASTCIDSLRTCNRGEDVCLNSLTEVVKGDKTEPSIIMSCAPLAYCKNQFIELSYGRGVYVRRQYDCCKTDGCVPFSTKMLPLNTTINGKYCPVCSLETGSCSDAVSLRCTGSATYCFEAVTKGIKDDMQKPIKGCTTESICNMLKTYPRSLIENSKIRNVTCQKANLIQSSSSSALQVFLLAFLPMKLFLLST